MGIVGPDAAMGSLSGRHKVSFHGFDDETKYFRMREMVKSAIRTMEKMKDEYQVHVIVLT
eukprot:CAMPEP_0201498942 /NCGR_PEP_ID=MMETSP0151_2-20130828/73730_1 /ASSEMBLY_ACC=CAM_ASM_000257 /TAXON_ID=200890 /ORGANISM="Paramoeba atlantica, Strain 621/1 / CCAP 1560/9" /LENGTH=59 /DNA_ID=CAMNT_0047890885 /DNA_START=93 /DNA_END=268 /DNA_ORIENTATION=-